MTSILVSLLVCLLYHTLMSTVVRSSVSLATAKRIQLMAWMCAAAIIANTFVIKAMVGQGTAYLIGGMLALFIAHLWRDGWVPSDSAPRTVNDHRRFGVPTEDDDSWSKFTGKS